MQDLIQQQQQLRQEMAERMRERQDAMAAWIAENAGTKKVAALKSAVTEARKEAKEAEARMRKAQAGLRQAVSDLETEADKHLPERLRQPSNMPIPPRMAGGRERRMI